MTHDAEEFSTRKLPDDLATCHALIEQERARNEELAAEHEKLRKLLSQLVNGSRSEKRILDSLGQGLLPFESEEEYQSAKAEAEAEAKRIIEKYEVASHEGKKKRRSESLPADLPRVEVPVEADDSLKHCPTHGQRTQIGEDIVETLVVEPPKAYVEVRRFPKFVCQADKKCGVVSAERPTGLTEGNRYSPSVAAAVIDYKWGHYLPIYRQQRSVRCLWLDTPAEHAAEPGGSHGVRCRSIAGLDEAACSAGHWRWHRRHELSDAAAEGGSGDRPK